MAKKITIKEVAKEAGVSIGTVSRVMRNQVDVQPEIRKRVLQASKDLGYQRLRAPKKSSDPHASGTGNIGLLMVGMDDTLIHLPVISAALHGIERAVSEKSMSLMISEVPDLDHVPSLIEKKKVDGVLIKCPQYFTPKSLENKKLLEKLNAFPLVWILGKPPFLYGDSLDTDNVGVGRLAAQTLIDHGHRRLGILNPASNHALFTERCDSFKLHAMKFQGEKVKLEAYERSSQNVKWPVSATYLGGEIEQLIEEWAKTPKAKRPTALYVPADNLAVKAYEALSKKKIEIGKEVSLLSSNHEIPILQGLIPSLATIDIHAEKVGRRAVEQLLWRMQNPMDKEDIHVTVEPKLIAGESLQRI